MKACNLADTAAVSRVSRVTLVLFFIAMASGFAQFGAVASLNDVAHHFGHHTSARTLQSVVGLSGSVLGIGLAVLRLASLASLPLAALADRWGRVRVLRRTLWLGLLVTSVASLSPSYWIFVACFAFARPLLSATSTLIQVVTVELTSSARRIHRLVVVSAGAGLGAGTSAVLHGVIRGPSSFRWLFALALVPLFVMPRLTKSLPEPRHQRDQLFMTRLGAVAREWRPRLYVVAAVSFTIGVISGPANGFAFVYGEGVLRIAPHVVATVVALSAVTGLAGLLVGRTLSRRLGRRATVVLGVLATGLTSCVAYSGGRNIFILGYMTGVFAAGLLAPAAAALSTEIFPHRVRATTAGWIVVAGVVGATSGLFFFGWIADVVKSASANSLRVPALVTFLPLLPTLLLVRRLPETAGREID